ILDRVSTGSGSDLVKPWGLRIIRKHCMLISDQVATAPCTDPIQARFLLLWLRKDLLCVEDDRLRAALLRLLVHVSGAAWSITNRAVPKCDQRHVFTACVSERVVQVPQIVALPDVVIRFVLKPARQIFRFT